MLTVGYSFYFGLSIDGLHYRESRAASPAFAIFYSASAACNSARARVYARVYRAVEGDESIGDHEPLRNRLEWGV